MPWGLINFMINYFVEMVRASFPFTEEDVKYILVKEEQKKLSVMGFYLIQSNHEKKYNDSTRFPYGGDESQLDFLYNHPMQKQKEILSYIHSIYL